MKYKTLAQCTQETCHRMSIVCISIRGRESNTSKWPNMSIELNWLYLHIEWATILPLHVSHCSSSSCIYFFEALNSGQRFGYWILFRIIKWQRNSRQFGICMGQWTHVLLHSTDDGSEICNILGSIHCYCPCLYAIGIFSTHHSYAFVRKFKMDWSLFYLAIPEGKPLLSWSYRIVWIHI